jgi:hypothetical protein
MIKVEFKIKFDNSMTPNILVPLLAKALKEMGAIDAWGTISNLVLRDDEVNEVKVIGI